MAIDACTAGGGGVPVGDSVADRDDESHGWSVDSDRRHATSLHRRLSASSSRQVRQPRCGPLSGRFPSVTTASLVVGGLRRNSRVVFAGRGRGSVPVTEFRGMALNGIFYADVLRPLDLVPITDNYLQTTARLRCDTVRLLIKGH